MATLAVLPDRQGAYVRKQLPAYIEKILTHVKPAPAHEQDAEFYGYTYRLYRENNSVWLETTQSLADKLVQWAKRHHAESYVKKTVTFSTEEHRKPYYKRDYVLIVVSDPVAHQLEKVGLLK